MFAELSSEGKIYAMRLFRTYLFISMSFVFIFSAVFISYRINRMLKPVHDLTEGTKKVAGGDFGVVIPVDINRHDELRELTDSFNKMARELSLINMLNNDFINNVSHEFKTPISSIQGFAAVMLGTSLTDEQKEYAEIIAYESARLTRLTSDILRLTKLENQEIITEKEAFYIDEQIRHSFLLLQNEISQKNIGIDFDLEPTQYIGNPELVRLIWHNLLGNAIKFTNENCVIKISCFDNNNCVVVSIKDNGIGMDESTVTHIYDKFFQGDKSHSNEGNGLGLSLVSRVVELCEGTIDVDSKPGGGSEFTVKLPIQDRQLQYSPRP
jgi:signal transduction histidine kinase